MHVQGIGLWQSKCLQMKRNRKLSNGKFPLRSLKFELWAAIWILDWVSESWYLNLGLGIWISKWIWIVNTPDGPLKFRVWTSDGLLSSWKPVSYAMASDAIDLASSIIFELAQLNLPNAHQRGGLRNVMRPAYEPNTPDYPGILNISSIPILGFAEWYST